MNLPIRIRSGPTGWILVDLPYTEDRLIRIKTLSGCMWDPEHRCWAIPRTAQTLDRLLALFAGDQVTVDPDVRSVPAQHPGQRPAFKLGPGSASEAVQALADALRSRAYSPRTIRVYTLHIKRFFLHVPKTPQDISPEAVRAYLDGLLTEENVAPSYHNQAVRALKAFLSIVLKKPDAFLRAALPPRRKRFSGP